MVLVFIAINFANLVPACITASIYLCSLRDGISLDVSEVYFLISLASTLTYPSIALVRWYNFKVRSDVSFSRISKFLGLEAKKVSNRSDRVEKGVVQLKNYAGTWVDPEQAKHFKKINLSSEKKMINLIDDSKAIPVI
jgi:hypothetical protein